MRARPTEAAAELKARGAKYTNDDKKAFLEHLPLEQLERFLGKLEVVSVDNTCLVGL